MAANMNGNRMCCMSMMNGLGRVPVVTARMHEEEH